MNVFNPLLQTVDSITMPYLFVTTTSCVYKNTHAGHTAGVITIVSPVFSCWQKINAKKDEQVNTKIMSFTTFHFFSLHTTLHSLE